MTLVHRVRTLATWMNLTTPLGIAVALAGRARLHWGPDGLIIANGYRLGLPRAGAFTIGSVIASAGSVEDLERRRPGTLDHEARHAWQYAVAGVWFFPAYGLGSAWSLLRTGSPALGNPFERHAGLVSGGYLPGVSPEPSRSGGAPTGSADASSAAG